MIYSIWPGTKLRPKISKKKIVYSNKVYDKLCFKKN